MEVDPVLFRQFSRETLGTLAPHLRSWALACLLSGLPYEARMRERNTALRAAADFLPGALGAGERAQLLRKAMMACRRAARPAHPELDTLEGCIAAAFLARDSVPSVRQLRRILEGE